MSSRNVAARIRGRILQTIFQLLYTRLGFLHEVTGRVVYGSAWDGRRLHVLPADAAGRLLDIGCGEGRLLNAIAGHKQFAVGVDPSPEMTRRAHRRGVKVVRASAQFLPLLDDAVQHVIATYPGPWIFDAQTWEEIARVCAPGATVRILLGGDITGGRGAFIRSRLLRIAYGSGTVSSERLPMLGNEQVVGDYVVVEDTWGMAIVWSGNRVLMSS